MYCQARRVINLETPSNLDNQSNFGALKGYRSYQSYRGSTQAVTYLHLYIEAKCADYLGKYGLVLRYGWR